MSSRSADEIRAELVDWYKARAAVSRNQSYTINNRSLTRANLKDVNDTIASLEAELVRAESGGGARMRAGVPS